MAPIPFDEEWPLHVTAAALVRFAHHLVATAIVPFYHNHNHRNHHQPQQPRQQVQPPDPQQRHFFKTMASTRFAGLVAHVSERQPPPRQRRQQRVKRQEQGQQQGNPSTPPLHPLLPREPPPLLRGPGGYCGAMPTDQTICAKWPARFQKAAMQVNSTLGAVMDVAVRTIYVQDYIEELVAAFVGETHVLLFLEECLATAFTEACAE